MIVNISNNLHDRASADMGQVFVNRLVLFLTFYEGSALNPFN